MEDLAQNIDEAAAGQDGPPPHLLPGPPAHAVRLAGGAANTVWLVTLADGGRMVVKSTPALAPDAYAKEARGLQALRTHGALPTPRVPALHPDGLVLEALEQPPAHDTAFWERAAHALAGLHTTTGQRFGWAEDGWLGRLAQRNPWTQDGHEFFARHRLLRYLDEPLARQALGPRGRADLERICNRLPQLLPAAPPVLTHGDLWHANILARPHAAPAFIDPAVCWTWAETDLSMMFCTGGVPARFFDAYREHHPLTDGWQHRMRLLHLREQLSCAAHFGARDGHTGDLLDVLRTYR
ncbi:fructosamine kinase family protein [Kitasatospora sp. NPDC059811]|uniref:fructosamine kinase family protein n=1 Tax=Streptomycetaceae TaxID=2062 RepID=UPI0009A032B8|nr:fructosamine kinase family protein [Streptomyces sp. MJM8645]